MTELRIVVSPDKPEPAAEPLAVVIGGQRLEVADAPDGYAGLLHRCKLTAESRNIEIEEGRLDAEAWAVEEEWPEAVK